jgi:type III pantothenate kinase
MLLLIDAGNTRIKWAVLDSAQELKLGDWVQMGSLSHQEFGEVNPPWNAFSVKRVLVSNVAGDILRKRLLSLFHHEEVEWFDPETKKTKIKNQYRNPAQLGSDRFAAAIGAHALFPDISLLIATCGTALTMDAVTAEGNFIGGMIAPGLKLMAQSLAENTAQLPTVPERIAESERFAAHFANQTEEAIVSGCLAAQAGAIEHAAREFATTIKAEPLCIVSGGAAKYIMPSLRISHKFVDNLVLIGLQKIS